MSPLTGKALSSCVHTSCGSRLVSNWCRIGVELTSNWCRAGALVPGGSCRFCLFSLVVEQLPLVSTTSVCFVLVGRACLRPHRVSSHRHHIALAHFSFLVRCFGIIFYKHFKTILIFLLIHFDQMSIYFDQRRYILIMRTPP